MIRAIIKECPECKRALLLTNPYDVVCSNPDCRTLSRIEYHIASWKTGEVDDVLLMPLRKMSLHEWNENRKEKEPYNSI